MQFRGFPAEAMEFYERLEAENTKAFWQGNKATFESAVRAPMVALCEEFAGYGTFHLFRPYNDLRFAKGRPPYKTAQGAYVEAEGGTGYYVQLSAEGLMVAAGQYAMARDQLVRFRAAVDDETTGGEIEEITDRLAADGYSIGAMDELKSAPRGYAKDHRRIALLRRKGLMASRSWSPAKWMQTEQAATRVRQAWDGIGPLADWLDRNVGPSTMPPEESRFG